MPLSGLPFTFPGSRWLFIAITLTPKKSSTQCFISVLVDPDSTLEVYCFIPNNRRLFSVNTAYLIPSINLFSSLWVLVLIRMLVLTVHMLWYEYTIPIRYVWMMRFHWYRANSNRLIERSHWRASSRNWTYEFANYELGALTIQPWMLNRDHRTSWITKFQLKWNL